MSNKKHAVVIGAGVGGLTSAAILAKAGYKVTLYEKNSEPGGRMGIIKKDGFTFDTGPSWYLMKDVFEHFFALFGKSTSDYFELERLDPAYKVFFETMEPVVISGNFENNIETFERLEKGAGKQLQKYVLMGQKNYENALKYFLYNTFSRPQKLLNPATLKSLPSFFPVLVSSLHGYVKQRFSKQELQQMLEYPSVFLGASPFNTPALYQLMSYLDLKEGVFYPKRGGMYEVTKGMQKLAEEQGVTFLFNKEVQKIHSKDGLTCGISTNGDFIKADLVVANGDLQHTEQYLLDTQDRSYPDSYWTKSEAGPSALLLYLGIKGELPELDHHNLFFVNDWESNFNDIYKDKKWPDNPSLYVSKTSASDATVAPAGHENVVILVPLPSGVSHDDTLSNKFADIYLLQLERLSGISDFRDRIVFKEVRTPQYFSQAFYAWQNTALGMSHTLKQSAFFRPSVKSKKVKNLYYVGGGTQPGIGVPMCIISAQLVYKHLAGDTSPEPPKTIKELV